MATTATLWSLEDHTKGKHAVLGSYLNAWFPILSRYHERVLLIDGFAGPGRYATGEEGSPLIAIRTLQEHSANSKIKEAVCIFIEGDKERADHLEEELKQLESAGKIPNNCKWYVTHGAFDETMNKTFEYLDAQKKSLAPAFVMIDPFGVSDTPMSVIERLFKNERAEVYISVMYEWINRFKERPEFEKHLDKLFGVPDWRKGIDIEDSETRKEYLFELYEAQLKKAGAKYVVRFELFAGKRLKYAIFFGTTNLLGADKMKQAIWKIAPTGEFAFHGSRDRQLALMPEGVDFKPLLDAVAKYVSTKPSWVGVESVRDFVIAETDYTSSHYKANALKVLESNGSIEVDPTSRQKRGFFPDGTRLRWKR